MTSPTPQYTDFSKDVLGRYVCNGLDEALASTTGRPDARPFDIIVVGGGSFGPSLAQHALDLDGFGNHRILVLEAGPFVFPEHVQNLPMVGVVAPPPVTVDPGVPRAEVWGLPWRSNVPDGFPGLAYCTGGRSLFWGGWSPQLLQAETPADRWPASVLFDLRNRQLGTEQGYFHQAARQIGVTETNDFVFGAMHEALRQQLFDGLQANGVPNAVPLNQLPQVLDLPPGTPAAMGEQLKLEAPLAVQGRGPRSGFFPLNKFSGMPLLMKAARQAWVDSGGDDVRKRLMVVPNCHVTRLETAVDGGVGQVRVVHTSLGPIPVPDRGVVVLAAGTIESTRLALLSFPGTLGDQLIGTNLMAHMRSNYTFRVPRQALQQLDPAVADLQESALFVKGRKSHQDGSVSHFHLQITAAGLSAPGGNSEVELFQAIPDIDLLDQFQAIADDRVVITLRGVGEMQAQNPASRITLSNESDEFGVPRAFVQLGDARGQATPADTPQTVNDRELWQAMDNAADAVRDVIANGQQVEEVSPRVRDGLGSTHHESGTLWMGEDPTASVTTPNARFHHVVNTYAIGPALLPTMGSPNPMLSGVALARRLAEHLVAPLAPPQLEAGFAWLFDGTEATFADWAQAGPGSFQLVPGEQVLTAQPGNDIGLLYYTPKRFGDFILRLQVRIDGRGDNSGVFIRSFDPTQPPATLNDPRVAANPAYVAVDTGFEIQIDDLAQPDNLDKHRTGAIYDIELGPAAGQQTYRRGSALQPGEWNDLEIEVQGASYTARLNGYQTSSFTNKDPNRGLPPQADPNSGVIGLQEHTGRVSFRAIRIKQLP
jgi:choline dehydrogenase-like flavoprotein